MNRRTYQLSREISFFSSLRGYTQGILNAVSGCESVLDCGCGYSSLLRYFSCKRLVGVDLYKPDLERARQAGTHDDYVLLDVRRVGDHFPPKSFDACVSVDVIEHLTQDEGYAFLKSLESVAARRVVICTPNQFLPQSLLEAGDKQEHLSGWSPQQMRDLGYTVTGGLGSKRLRGEFHRLRYKPALFWALISWLSQALWCRNHPDSAAALICVKEVSRQAG